MLITFTLVMPVEVSVKAGENFPAAGAGRLRPSRRPVRQTKAAQVHQNSCLE
jgi:hypothetical protein